MEYTSIMYCGLKSASWARQKIVPKHLWVAIDPFSLVLHFLKISFYSLAPHDIFTWMWYGLCRFFWFRQNYWTAKAPQCNRWTRYCAKDWNSNKRIWYDSSTWILNSWPDCVPKDASMTCTESSLSKDICVRSKEIENCWKSYRAKVAPTLTVSFEVWWQMDSRRSCTC